MALNPIETGGIIAIAFGLIEVIKAMAGWAMKQRANGGGKSGADLKDHRHEFQLFAQKSDDWRTQHVKDTDEHVENLGKLTTALTKFSAHVERVCDRAEDIRLTKPSEDTNPGFEV